MLIYTIVALRKESVDRNYRFKVTEAKFFCVALRKESVDRNVGQYTRYVRVLVALRKESVDRNRATEITDEVGLRRSPQGERG